MTHIFVGFQKTILAVFTYDSDYLTSSLRTVLIFISLLKIKIA